MSNQPIEKSYQNAIATARRLGFQEPDEPRTKTNPYTGVACRLEPLACMMYDFITTRIFVCGKDYTRRDWDNARYFFCATWPDEYYKLID